MTQIDPGLPLYQARTLDAVRWRLLGTERLTAGLTGLFSLVSLVLAGVGLFGVLAQDVESRRRDIGIRMALGARTSVVRWTILRAALILSSIGLLSGAVMAAAGWQIAGTIVGPLEAPGAAVLLTDAAVIVVAALVAAWVPAHRATRVDPATTLRSM